MDSTQLLGQQIEALVRAHVTAHQVELTASVTAAVMRGFASVENKPVSQRPQTKSPSKHAQSQKTISRSKHTQARTPEELAALSEAFYSAVCDKPGETMLVLAAQIGATTRQLKVPVLKLKQAGRVHSVGGQAKTRYFPRVGGAKASQEVSS